MKKIDLGNIAATSSKARPTHPTVECSGEMKALLEQFAVINPQFKTLKNQSETLSKQIAPQIRALYFRHFNGIAPESSTMIVTAGGRSIKLITKDRYSLNVTDESGLIE